MPRKFCLRSMSWKKKAARRKVRFYNHAWEILSQINELEKKAARRKVRFYNHA